VDTARGWSGAVRGSFVTDANIRDFTIFSTGLDATVSRTFFGMLTPYAGAGMNWNHGHIVSNEVNLANENSLGFRGLAGLDFRCKFVTLGYEMQFGDGRANRSFNLGVLF
jgi:opacity protein-like surface antigen